MMPELLAEQRVGASRVSALVERRRVAAPLGVSDLSCGERAAALYASDMPTSYRYRGGDDHLVEDWIVQGIERIGLAVAHERSVLQRGYTALDLNDAAGEDIEAGYRAMYPDAKRDSLARDMAALSVLSVSPSRKARARGDVDVVAHAVAAFADTSVWCGDDL